MPLQLSHLYDALLDAGASKESATKASEEVAAYDARLHGFAADLSALRADFVLVKWMLGTLIALGLLAVGIGLTTLSRLTVP